MPCFTSVLQVCTMRAVRDGNLVTKQERAMADDKKPEKK
jgi:hypothetical protein